MCNSKAQVKVERGSENKSASIMATQRPGRPITRRMAYTKAPVSLGDFPAESSSGLIRVVEAKAPAHAGVRISFFQLVEDPK